MARPTELDQIGYIYFISSPTQDAVKVGFAQEVYTRHKSLQTGNPADLTLVGTVRATYGAEMELHKMLKGRRIRLEWYRDDEVIGSIINSIQDEHLDMTMMWLLEHKPHSTNVADLEAAAAEVVITAPIMRQIIEAELAELAAA